MGVTPHLPLTQPPTKRPRPLGVVSCGTGLDSPARPLNASTLRLTVLFDACGVEEPDNGLALSALNDLGELRAVNSVTVVDGCAAGNLRAAEGVSAKYDLLPLNKLDAPEVAVVGRWQCGYPCRRWRPGIRAMHCGGGCLFGG